MAQASDMAWSEIKEYNWLESHQLWPCIKWSHLNYIFQRQSGNMIASLTHNMLLVWWWEQRSFPVWPAERNMWSHVISGLPQTYLWSTNHMLTEFNEFLINGNMTGYSWSGISHCHKIDGPSIKIQGHRITLLSFMAQNKSGYAKPKLMYGYDN